MERESWVVPLYKGKGDAQECKNYRGIKLLSHTMKLWERVVEGRLRRQTKVSEIVWFCGGQVNDEFKFYAEADDGEVLEGEEEEDAFSVCRLRESI